MILPDALLGEYEKKAELYNQTASKTEQIALCSFIRDGNLSIRIRKNQKDCIPKKMKLLTSALKEVFGDKANIYIGETGFVLRLEIKMRYVGKRNRGASPYKRRGGKGERHGEKNIRRFCSCARPWRPKIFCRLQKDFTAVYSEHKKRS